MCRPALSSHIGEPAAMRAAAAELFDLVARGILRVEIGRTYALRDAAVRIRRSRRGRLQARSCWCREWGEWRNSE